MIVVFLGPPGAGKGTQCTRIVERYGVSHLSSGDILRRERKEGTELGQQAQGYMDRGELVPDELIVAMMAKEMRGQSNPKGFILDGFPRTLGQAEELDKALTDAGETVDVALELMVDDDKLERRITGRRTAPQSGAVYHIETNPPKVAGVCDISGEPLVQRPDDTAEVVRQRIKTYHDQTEPLIAYYESKGVLSKIDGNSDIDQVTESIFKVLDAC